MTQFRYQALEKDGSRTSGQLEAGSVEQAVSQLQAGGLMIIDIRPARSGVLTAGLFSRVTIPGAEIARFTEQLATLLDAGQPLESALALQARQAGKQPMGELLARLLEQVKGGSSLSAAMAEERQVFSNFYLSLVRAGEAAGMLAQTLAQLAHYLERSQSMRSDMISALIYPAFLVVGVLGSLILLLAYVVPQFVPIFKDLNVELPLITEVILHVGEFLAQWTLHLLLLLALGGWWLAVYLRDPARRLALDTRLLRLKAFGPVMQGMETARFALTLGTLLDKKVSLLAGMNITRQVASNRAMGAALEQATLGAKEGRALSAALEQTRVFPELAVQMIRVGEQSGQLGTMLLKLAEIYDKETQSTLKRFMAALVPMLTLIMTGLVAIIMLAIMLPLMSLTSNI